MAARNFTSAGVNNLWSNPANWDGGASPPVNNDSVTIPLGQVCEFDADLSGFADGIDGITITGTLSLTRTPGTYYLKIKAAKTIGGAGTFDCGTALSPIPFAAKHTITGGAGWYIKGNDGAGMTMTVYAAEPAIKTVLLTGAESAGATVLEVDTDITGDIWQDGDTIRIDNIAGAKSSEERIIAAGGRAAGAITITAGLTGAQMAGATVILITRNVVFLASGNLLSGFTTGKLTIGGGRFSNGTGYALNGCIGAVINGGAFSNFNRFADACNDTTVNGGVFSFFNAIFNACFGTVVNGGHISAAINIISSSPGSTVNNVTARGGEALLAGSAGCTINGGTVIGAKWPIKNSSAVIKNASFTGSTFSDAFTAVFTAFNTLFASTNENTNYNQNAREAYSDSYDHDQVPGAYKAWTKGGVTTLQTTTKPTGHASAMQTVLENAAVEGYWQKEITVTAGASVSLEMWLRKDGAMTYLPRCIVFNKAAADPFAGGAGLRTFTMTNSVDTWESDTYTYTNTGTADVTLVIRFQGMAASGNVFSELVAEVINVDLTAALAQLAAIKAKTDNLPTDPADQSLLEAAISAIPAAPTAQQIWEYATRTITAGGITPQEVWEYATRELTAGGLTAQEVWEYVTRTLTEGGITPSDVWTHPARTLTMTAAEIAAALSGANITMQRGDSFSLSITGLGDLTGYVSLDFTVKRHPREADTAALVRVRKNASGVGDGLLVLNGATGTAAQGSITIDSLAAGNITLAVAAASTAQLEPGETYRYDIQQITATGAVSTLAEGTFVVAADVTRAVS